MTEQHIVTWPPEDWDWQVGDVLTIKGKLQHVGYEKINGTSRYARGSRTVRSLPANLSISFSDWSVCYIDLASNAVARSIEPIPLGSYVTLKARVKDEYGNLEGVAIWTPGGAPIPLCG